MKWAVEGAVERRWRIDEGEVDQGMGPMEHRQRKEWHRRVAKQTGKITNRQIGIL
jgi:hypothetical protein